MAAASTRSVRVILSATVNDFTSKMGQAQSAVETLTTKIGKVSQTQAWSDASTDLLKLGVTLSSIGVIAAKMGADFTEQMSAVSATGQDARENIDALKKAAIEAGAEFGQFTATEAADGITQLAKAGMSAADILSGGLRGSLAMAASGQMAVADAAELTAMTLTQFSLKGNQASHVADLLAAGAGKAVGDVADLGQALSNGGSVAAQYGISVEETVGALAMFAQNALVGAEAGTAMKSMLMQLASPTKEAQQALDRYGISIYDARGDFVGLESLAGQLKTQLGGLDQETQNATLSTIFGSYAIRAANILYKEGAEGVAEWTSAVDDQGFAMTQAAALTDNLKGDIAELGGAFETAMIQVGENSQNSLRIVVQGLTAVIELAGEYPGITTGVVGFASALGALALTAGGVMKLTTAFTAFKASLDVLKVSMSTLTLGAGAVGVALAVLGGVVAAFASAHQEAKARVEGFTNALTGNSEASDEAARAQAALNLQQSGALDIAAKYGIQTSLLTDAVLGDVQAREQAVQAIRAQADEIRAQLDTMTTYQQDQTASGQELSAQYQVLMRDLGILTGAVDENADAYQQAKQESDQLAEASANTADATKEVEDAIAAATDEIIAQIEATKELVDSMNELGNIALTLSGSEIALEKSYAAATKAITENGVQIDVNTGKIDISTEKGRENKKALDDVASALLKNRDAMLDSGATTDELNAQTAAARARFVEFATQMGLNEDAANTLADSYQLIPTTITTSTSLDTASATNALNAYKYALGTLDGRRVTSYAETIYVQSGNKTAIYATGGAVRGPGTSTSDSIPALLSNGEHVLTAREVQALGGHDAVFRLRALALAGALPKFATGGPAYTPRKYADGGPAIKAFNTTPTSGTAGSSRGDIYFTINNPISEPTSKTVATTAAHFGTGI